ncbi:MAG: NAD(P)-dependent oxidoreductase, partial [Selenomonas sp.]|nr:NAD(P)-dependent oxidoreductase [Selenomonas sp.]
MMNNKNVMVIGVDNFIGKALAEYLQRSFDVLGVATRYTATAYAYSQHNKCLLCTAVQSLSLDIDVDIIYYVHGYRPYMQANVSSSSLSGENRLLQSFLKLAIMRKAKFVYLSTMLTDATLYGQECLAAEGMLKKSAVDYDIVRIPEVEAPDGDCYLRDITKRAQENKTIVIDSYDNVPQLIWLDDLIDYMSRCACTRKTREIIPHDTMTNKALLLNIGMMTKSISGVVSKNMN